MEGKRITELSGTGRVAGMGLRVSCHFEENYISFCDLKRGKVKTGGLGWTDEQSGPQGNLRGTVIIFRGWWLPVYSIIFPLWMWRENHPALVMPNLTTSPAGV